MSKSFWGALGSICFGIIINFAPVPQGWRLPLTIAAAAGLFLSIAGWVGTHVGTRTSESDRTRPLVAALRELKAQLFRGETMLGAYYVEGTRKPNIQEYSQWRDAVGKCASDARFEGYVSLADLKRLEDREFDENFLRIKTKFHDAGYLSNLAPSQVAVFDALLLAVERLKELISKVESR